MAPAPERHLPGPRGPSHAGDEAADVIPKMTVICAIFPHLWFQITFEGRVAEQSQKREIAFIANLIYPNNFRGVVAGHARYRDT